MLRLKHSYQIPRTRLMIFWRRGPRELIAGWMLVIALVVGLLLLPPGTEPDLVAEAQDASGAAACGTAETDAC